MLRNVEILRVERGGDGTFGMILIDNKAVCLSLEPFDSIPEDSYLVKADDTGRWRYYRVENVIGFTNIEFHTGNSIKDTAGCILTGTSIGRIGEQRCVLQSRKAMDVFQDALGGDQEFTLTIKSVC